MKANEIFEKEWALWEKSGLDTRLPPRCDEMPAGNAAGPAAAGELRLLAGLTKPLVALVVAEKGAAGYLVVPVSPFTVPASPREMLAGDYVLQLWNACIAAKRLVENGWIVAKLDPADAADAAKRLANAAPGCTSAGESAVARYEKSFLVAGGAFTPLVAARAPEMSLFSRFARVVRRAALVGGVLVIGAGATSYFARDAQGMFGVVGRAIWGTSLKGIEYREASCESTDYCGAAQEEGGAYSTLQIQSPVRMFSQVASRAPAPALLKTKSLARDSFEDRLPPGAMVSMQDTEKFADFRENEFLDPASAPLSTFSLDVDTTSYTLMRRCLTNERRLPPKHSVRLEEYVNYFKYNYAQPEGDMPIGVDCELGDCPWNAEHKLLRVGVQAKTVAQEALPPCNLTFLVDCSGSMDWNNGMTMLKGALRLLVERLRPEDHVSIVTYANGTDVRLRSTPGSEKQRILDAIDSLGAGGGTSGGAGIQLAYEEAQRNFDKAANNRVILVTDGDFNIGASSPRELEDLISGKRSSGIFLSVFGVGAGNYNDATMKRLANTGNGNYAYFDSMLEAKKVMVSEFSGTLLTVAKDVKLQLEFNSAKVAGYRLLGYECRMLQAKDFNDDKKDAGEIGAGHTMTALYEIIPANENGAAAHPAVDPLKYQKTDKIDSEGLFTVKFRWKAPDGDTSKKAELEYTIAQLVKSAPSEDFRFASAVAEYALLLSDSQFKANASFAALIDRARASKGADAEGYRAEFIRLAEAAELLAK